jgi:hypothetical protein
MSTIQSTYRHDDFQGLQIVMNYDKYYELDFFKIKDAYQKSGSAAADMSIPDGVIIRFLFDHHIFLL